MEMENSVRPQPAQEAFLRSAADVAIFGGAAGGGKSYALLLEPVYHMKNAKFRGVIFRRTIPQLKLQGGLWDSSEQIYTLRGIGAVPNESAMEWRFPSGAVLKFSGMEHEKDRLGWQGSQMPFIVSFCG